MMIEAGKFYVNKTRKLLLPTLKDHGEKLMKAINCLQKLSVGIGDNFIENSIHENHLYLLVDIRGIDFKKILNWIKKQPFFVKDYPFDDIINGYQHMIVVKIPDEYEIAKLEFLKSRYSRMYTKQQIDSVFGGEYIDVLVRDKKKLVDFIDTVNRIYDSKIEYEKWEGEVEFPFVKKEEIFNIGE